MKGQLKLRLCLLSYLCLLLINPGWYGQFVIFLVATIIAASASIAFIAFLLSRKPAESNILNRQLVILFFLKLLSYPYYLGLVYYWYRSYSQLQSKQEDWEEWELGLMGTLFSLSSARIVSILSIVMYTLVSASRTLLFISPAKFNYLNKKLVLYSTILIVVLVFAFEIFMSQVVFSPGRCEVNESGNQIHSLASNSLKGFRKINFNISSQTYDRCTSTIFNETIMEFPDFISSGVSNNVTNLNLTSTENNNNQTGLEFSVKTCTLFPSLRIWTFMFLDHFDLMT